MKILVDCATLSKGGGVAVYVEKILGNFSERDSIVILAADGKSAEIFGGRRNFKVKAMKFYSLLTRAFYEQVFIPLYGLIAGADVLFIPKQYAPLLKTVRVVSTLHDFIPEKRESGEDFITRLYWKIQYNMIRMKSDGIIFPAASVMDEYKKRFKGFGGKKVAFIPDGFDSYKKAEGGEKIILLPSTVKSRKNLHLSLSLAEMIKREHPDKRIVMTGRCDSKSLMERLKRNHPDFEYLGYVDRDRIEELFNNAFVVLFLSAKEGYGLPVAEAISLQKRVIAAKTSLNESIYREMPIYYNLEMTLEENYPAISKKLKEGVKYEEKTRSWKEAAEETEHFIESVVG